ncbi:MAG: PEGA domain-containing protein, partial [Methanospirillum sp.]|nr:PEGA domain-containing protein [Methanospirillum sp.]
IGGDSGWYRITSEPPGADVIFDGNDIGQTPLTVKVYSTGTPGHSVSMRLDGYKEWTTHLSGNPGQGETVPVPARLVREEVNGRLSVSSAPSGARIQINGMSRGYTPVSFDRLPPGWYTITLSREGYERWTRSMRIDPGDDEKIYAILDPSFAPITSGTLMVESTPAGAEIILDKDSRGYTPRTLTLPEGSHSLVLRLAGYPDYSTSIFISNRETTRISVPLNGDTGHIVAVHDPPEVSPAFSPEDLISLGDEASGFLARVGREAFIAEINRQDGTFARDTMYVTVLSENGTLLADPKGEDLRGVNITSLSDRNTVPYGMARIALAREGGGLLYESDVSNTTPEGGILVTAVRPEEDGLIIAASHQLSLSLPEITPSALAALVSRILNGDDSLAGSLGPDGTIDQVPSEIPGGSETLNKTDQNGVRSLPVIQALAAQDGGPGYIRDPASGSDNTLTLTMAGTDAAGQTRWSWIPAGRTGQNGGSETISS